MGSANYTVSWARSLSPYLGKNMYNHLCVFFTNHGEIVGRVDRCLGIDWQIQKKRFQTNKIKITSIGSFAFKECGERLLPGSSRIVKWASCSYFRTSKHWFCRFLINCISYTRVGADQNRKMRWGDVRHSPTCYSTMHDYEMSIFWRLNIFLSIKVTSYTDEVENPEKTSKPRNRKAKPKTKIKPEKTRE